MTEPPADPTTKPLEGFGVWGPNVVGWGSDDDPLAALRAELLRARSELQLGGGQPAAETLARVRARLAAAAEPQTVPPGADSAVVQAAAHATIARLRERLGESDRAGFALAVQMFDEAHDRAPETAAVFEPEYAMALAHVGRFDDAWQRVDLLGPGRELVDVLVDLAAALRRAQRPEAAVTALEHAAELAPDDAQVQTTLGELLADTGERDRAARAYRAAALALSWREGYGAGEAAIDRALELVPGDAESVAVKVEFLRVTGRHEQAPELVAAARRERPSDLRLLALQARTLVERGCADEALRVLDEAPQGEATSELHLARALALRNLNRLDDALEQTSAAAALAPSDPVVHAAHAELEFRLGRYNDSLASLDAALELQPVFPDALAFKAGVLRRVGDVEEAVDTARRALELAPDHVAALDELGESLRMLGKLDEARAALEHSLELDPSSGWTLGTLGQVLSELGDPGGAVALLERAVDADPTLAWARNELAMLLASGGEASRALSIVDEGMRLGSVSSLEMAGLLTARGDVLRRLDRPAEALEALASALELVPDSAFALGTVGEVLLDLDRPEDALEPLRQAAAELPGAGWIAAAYADALLDTERPIEAFDVLWRAQETGAEEHELTWIATRLAKVFVESNPARMLERVKEALAQRHEWEPALVIGAAALEALGELDEAEAVIDGLLERNPGDFAFLRRKGELVLQRSSPEEAETWLRVIVESHSDFGWAQGVLGRALQKRGDHRGAVGHLRKAFDLGEDFVSELVEALHALDRSEEALDLLDDAVKADPASAVLHAERGHTLWTLDRNEEALTELDLSLGTDPEVAWVLASRGGVLLDLGRYADAVTSCDEALEYSEASITLLFKARALVELGEFEDAIPALTRALELEEGVDAFALRGWAAQNVGQARQSLADYEEAVRAEPDDLWWHKGVADALGLVGDKGKNEKFRWILARLPEAAEAMTRGDAVSLCGWCHYQLGNYDEAIEAFSDAVALDSLDTASQFDLALATICRDDPRHAVVEYQRGLDLASQQELRAASLLHVALVDLREAARTDREVFRSDEAKDIEDALHRARETAREAVAEARRASVRARVRPSEPAPVRSR